MNQFQINDDQDIDLEARIESSSLQAPNLFDMDFLTPNESPFIAPLFTSNSSSSGNPLLSPKTELRQPSFSNQDPKRLMMSIVDDDKYDNQYRQGSPATANAAMVLSQFGNLPMTAAPSMSRIRQSNASTLRLYNPNQNNHMFTCGLCTFDGADIMPDSCRHTFHSGCLQEWASQNKCPTCQKPVLLFYPISYLAYEDRFTLPDDSNQLTHDVEGDSVTTGHTFNRAGYNFSTPESLEGLDILSLEEQSDKGKRRKVAKRQLIKVETIVPAVEAQGDFGEEDKKVHPSPQNAARDNLFITHQDEAGPSSVCQDDSKDTMCSDESASKKCSVEGCHRGVRSRGLCKGHGGGLRCKSSGCGLSDQGGGYCINHGGGRRCRMEGCMNSRQSRGLCKLHGGGSRCTIPNCSRSSQGGGLCRTHGGGKRCTVEGCSKTDRRGGFCAKHGAYKKCQASGCTKTRRNGNFCNTHALQFLDYDSCHSSTATEGDGPTSSPTPSFVNLD